MAAADKIRANTKREFLEFYNWCEKFQEVCLKETQKNILDYFYVTPETYDTAFSCYSNGVPVANFPAAINKWLAKHCPIVWVRERYDYISSQCKTKDILLYIDKS